MSAGAAPTLRSRFAAMPSWELVLPIGIVASLVVILVPIPPALMDFLLAANISLAVVMLLTTIYVRTPLEFSIFPTLLLATTLWRLVLNVASTRLILTRAGEDGMLAAGGVIRSFGEFVAGDKVVVGLVIFAILVLIQFVVITKGATRISEVAARFALDGTPGRQMAIDADLNAGLIDQRESQRRRLELTEQADFFGAMDGASKFIRGDAIAGLAITLVNIVGGLAIGVAEMGMPLGQASQVFTKLTIGDGLVSQVPALLISLAAGLLVTRSSTAVNLPNEFLRQLVARPQVLAVTAAFLGVLVFTELPKIPLSMIGVSCVGLALLLTRRQREASSAEDAARQAQAARKPECRVEDFLAVDPLEIEVGVGLIRLADPKRGGDLLDRIQRVRQQIATDLGIVLPKVRVRDNTRLERHAYRIKLADVPVADGNVVPGRLLAIPPNSTVGGVDGEPALDPATGAPAVWIDPTAIERAVELGYQIIEPGAVIAAHLTQIVLQHADDLLTRDATRQLVEQLKATAPAVVEELIPAQLKLAEVQTILQSLVREGVSIRPLATILEALGDLAPREKNPQALVEHVRGKLARFISHRFRDHDGVLRAVTLAPSLEEGLRSAVGRNDRGAPAHVQPAVIETICTSLERAFEESTTPWRQRIALVAAPLRAALRESTAARLPQLVVLSYDEITRDTRVEVVSVAGDAAAAG